MRIFSEHEPGFDEEENESKISPEQILNDQDEDEGFGNDEFDFETDEEENEEM